jgi:acyl-CoA synthetase (AMP-forming)/AMP-acid ligase II
MPFFHVAGVVSIIQSLAHASTLVLPAPHFSGEYALQTIVKEKCDVIYGTPSSKKAKVQSPFATFL